MRTFSEEEIPDEEALKLKSQSWMLFVRWIVSADAFFV
jgi:hypothetical protein